MPDHRLWTYHPHRRHPSSGTDRLLAQLLRKGRIPDRPVHFSLADVCEDTDLSPADAVTALQELQRKGLISVFPTPRLTHIGQPTTYTVWLLPLPS
jgi:CRP-like cAMP-binding protein